ncbi:antibiotic biosynthesis monooxygenase [Rhodobacteraceae bacterium NNCM2]|nr:antibiotic biosynthesis monooxygenase [Coraliihabitans acroporae]
MFAVTVIFNVNQNDMAAFLPLVRAQAANSLELESDCHLFDVWTDPARPDQVMLYEIYTDAAAFDLHLATDHFKTFSAAVEPMLMGKEVATWARQEKLDG